MAMAKQSLTVTKQLLPNATKPPPNATQSPELGLSAVNLPGCALGVTASAKVGKSVKRNRIKRQIKENYRYFEMFVRVGYMYVFIVRARQNESLPDFYEVRREMKSLFVRAGVFDIQKWENSQNGA